MSTKSKYKKLMVESGKVTPTSFDNDPNFPAKEFVDYLNRVNYLMETVDENLDELALNRQIKEKKGSLYEIYSKINPVQLEKHNAQILSESKDIKDLKELL